MAPLLLVVAALLAVGAGRAVAQRSGAIPLDTPSVPWIAAPSDGVEMRLAREGGELRVDFDFRGHGGYAIARKRLRLDLPPNYEVDFRIRGEAPVENLELKLIDTTSANVWWDNRRDFHFPREWTTVRTKRRHIGFAWGPQGGGEPGRIGALELVVTAGTGGKGTVWIDSLRLRALPPEGPYTLTPAARASSSLPGAGPALVLDSSPATAWRTRAAGAQWLTLDFLREREFGGLVLGWGARPATAYDVQLSDDGRVWHTAYSVRGGNGGRDYLYMPESEARFLRLMLRGGGGPAAQGAPATPSGELPGATVARDRTPRGAPASRRAAAPGGYELATLRVEPLSFAATPDSFFAAVAREAPRGRYPRAYLGRQDYWTITGVPGDGREALLDVAGRVEPARGSFSIEPFVYEGGRLLTWADGTSTPSLARGDLPVPSVRRVAGGLALTVTAFVAGEVGASTLWVRYRLANEGAARRAATLFLALRPFQVNPPWQFLATQGGVSPIRAIGYDGGTVRADGRRVVAVTAPERFGAASFDAGDITDYLAAGRVPASTSASDSLGFTSGALSYALDLPAGASSDVFVAVPLDDASPPPAAGMPGDSVLARVERDWAAALDRVEIELGGEGGDVARSIRTNLAYVLLNRDGAALRPGSRSYARSWIRDGALMSAALLRLGHSAEVADYIRWYAPYQFPSGKVPCCVDARGADPVPENDSHGELIYLVAEYFRFTGDTALVGQVWPHVAAAAAYIDTLRAQRRTPEYAAGAGRLFYGLLPESISHEGYSAKPMHSYWDDLWALKGLEDAEFLARSLGRDSAAAALARDAGEFRSDLHASMRASMEQHHIDYIPGSAELGDFDATSTTIGVAPAGELGQLPEPALHRTFERYWQEFVARRDGTKAWDNYTPYEWRVVGTFVRLGWRERAQEAVRFFMDDRRPPQWNHWAEVVWRDSLAPRFIGDMPHTWVGSDFLRSALDMLAYVRETDGALVVGAGVPAGWLASPGVSVRGLRTIYGPLELEMAGTPERLTVRVGGGLRVPAAGVVIAPPLPAGGAEGLRAYVDGVETPFTGGEVHVQRLPAVVEVRRP